VPGPPVTDSMNNGARKQAAKMRLEPGTTEVTFMTLPQLNGPAWADLLHEADEWWWPGPVPEAPQGRPHHLESASQSEHSNGAQPRRQCRGKGRA
jgi:hypothetical protein